MTKNFQVNIEPDGGFTVPLEILDRLDLNVGDDIIFEEHDDFLRIRKASVADSETQEVSN